MSIYADSSFFVSYYLQDSHPAEVKRLMALMPRIWFTPFQRVELIHAIYQHVFRRFITSSEAQAVFANLEQDCNSNVWVPVRQPEGVFDRCEHLAHRRVAALGVRTLDTLHVAAALELGATRFWTFDERQKKLAEAEGLATS